MLVTGLRPAGSGAPTGRPVAGFHNWTVPSWLAVASMLPSGLNTRFVSDFAASGEPIGPWEATFHSCTAP